MHPALSVIAFTSLSGAGFGLLAWLGLSLLALLPPSDAAPGLLAVQLWSLLLGAVLAVAGLLSSLAHLGRPERAWRALSQWRTSWLSREGVLAIVTLLLALGLGLLLVVPGKTHPALSGTGGLALALLALATVASSAMIYASLPPIPAWRHPLVLPVYLLFALLTGLAIGAWLMAMLAPGARGTSAMLPALTGLGLLLAGFKLVYWHAIDRQTLPASRGDAVGLPGRDVRPFERPHTADTFITREMGFVAARRHARVLRLAVTALLLTPGAAWLLSGVLPPTLASGPLALALLLAAFVERWLFFAQARHLVTLYH